MMTIVSYGLGNAECSNNSYKAYSRRTSARGSLARFERSPMVPDEVDAEELCTSFSLTPPRLCAGAAPAGLMAAMLWTKVERVLAVYTGRSRLN